MSASRSFSDAIRGVGRNALDVPVAALAALAVAFVAFSMPADLLSQLVGYTGLPNVLSAAEPPLGMKARIGVGAAGAIAVFALVFGLLRLLDRKGRDRSVEATEEEEMPRLRRRDFHPDAPARRPLSANRELGEPESAPQEMATTPLWLSPAEPGEAEALEELDELEEEEVAVAESGSPPIEEESIDSFEPLPLTQPQFIETEAEQEPESLPQPEAEAVHRSASIAELMERLEQGLARRQTPQAVAASQTPSPTPSPLVPDAADDRLQSAIDSLQRLAARQA